MAQFSTVLVPTDFSEEARAAFPVAALEAKLRFGRIELVHVFQTPAMYFSWSNPTPKELAVEKIFGDARDAAKERLEELARVHFPDTPWKVSIVEHSGQAGDALSEHARQGGHSLIVMASHGGGFLRRTLIGCVAERVLRTAPCPVLIAPRDGSTQGRPYQRILVATDFSKASDEVFAVAMREAKYCQAKMTVIHVAEKARISLLSQMEKSEGCSAGREKGLSEYLVEAARRLGGDSVEHMLLPETPAVGYSIIEHVRKVGADLLVIGTRGSGSLFSLGGVAEKIVRSAPCPVLTVPADLGSLVHGAADSPTIAAE
jgi:nucleotide-binding universal stress UspA family protein